MDCIVRPLGSQPRAMGSSGFVPKVYPSCTIKFGHGHGISVLREYLSVLKVSMFFEISSFVPLFSLQIEGVSAMAHIPKHTT